MDNTLLRQKTKFIFSSLLGMLLLASCGSYQQASYYENDGIYGNNYRTANVEKRSAEGVRNQTIENNTYGDYFGQRADEYAEILDSEIFTDVDDYNSGAAYDSQQIGEQVDYFADNNTYEGNPSWGDNPTVVNIDVYDNFGFGGFGFGGFGFNRFGFGSPFYGGFYNPYRFGGFGFNRFGFAGYNRFRFGGLFGCPFGFNCYGGFGNSYFGYGGFGFGGFNRFNRFGRRGFNNFGFNTNRRGIASNSIRGRSSIISRSNSGRSISRNGISRSRSNSGRTISRTGVSRSRSNGVARRSVGSEAIARNRNFRTSRSTRSTPRFNGITRSGRTFRGSGTRSTGQRSTVGTRSSSVRGSSTGRTTRSSGVRSSSRNSSRSSGFRSSGNSSRRSSGSVRSSSRSSRSSGSFRSSGRSSSSRSSGARSSSSRSSSRSSGRSSRGSIRR